MIVKVKYYNDSVGGYTGNEYTYKTSMKLKPYMKVLAPVGKDETRKAIVTKVDLPETEIKKEWADRVKEITEYDKD